MLFSRETRDSVTTPQVNKGFPNSHVLYDGYRFQEPYEHTLQYTLYNVVVMLAHATVLLFLSLKTINLTSQLNKQVLNILINVMINFNSDEYWQNHPELHDVPIYYASQLAKKCMSGKSCTSNSPKLKDKNSYKIKNFIL